MKESTNPVRMHIQKMKNQPTTNQVQGVDLLGQNKGGSYVVVVNSSISSRSSYYELPAGLLAEATHESNKFGAEAPIQKGNHIMTENKVSGSTNSTPTSAFEFTQVGLKLNRPPTIEDVTETLRGVRDGREQDEWVIGDAVLYGIEAFGEKNLKEIATNLKMDYGTMRTRKWVSQNVPFAMRVAALSWRHHREVAGCLTLESKQGWLKSALNKSWSARELGKQIAASKPTEVKPKIANCKTTLKQIQQVGTEVVTGWGQWTAEERAALHAILQKLGTIITKDSTGILMLIQPTELPAMFAAAANAIATAVQPAQFGNSATSPS